jgi:hypothetical protein
MLADGFCRIVQPFTIRQQSEQFDGAEKPHRVRLPQLLATCWSLPMATGGRA